MIHVTLTGTETKKWVVMGNVTSLLVDAFIFVFVPWGLWQLLRRSIPIAILSILVGILLAVLYFPASKVGIPSLYSDYIG